MTRLSLYAIVGLLSGVGVVLVPDEWSEAHDLLLAVAGGVLIFLIDQMISSWRWIGLAWSAVRYRKRDIRVSASYLYRIKIDGRYLLIRGNRVPHQFQPVGGVYKRYPDSVGELAKLGVRDDASIPIDDSNRQDLRIRVSGRNLLRFMRWYARREGREVETWREFQEELLGPGLLPSGVFPHLFVKHVRQVWIGVRWSPHFQSQELLLADVVEVLWTPQQEAALRETMDSGQSELLWVTEEEIRSRGYDPKTGERTHISETAEWTL